MAIKIVRNILTGIVLPVNVIVAVLTLAGAYGEYVSPLWCPYPAMLGLAFPILAIINVCFMLVWLFVRRLFVLLPLLTTLACAPAIWKYSPIHDTDYIDDNRPGFSVLSYNVYYFNDFECELHPEYPEPAYNRTLQQIIDADADVVLAQECRLPEETHWRGITDGQLQQLHRRYPYRAKGTNSFVLSRYPIEFIADTMYSTSATTYVCRIDIDGRQVTFFNNHLESIGLNKEDKEMYREITVQPDSIRGNVGNIKQMLRKFFSAFAERAGQVQYIDSLAHAIGGNIIMCGDINDTPNSYAYRVLAKGRNDAYLQLGSGPGFTYQSNRMWVRIDHVFYEGDFVARQLVRGDSRSSDHYSLFVRFGWQP